MTMFHKIALVLDRFGFTPYPRYQGGAQVSSLSFAGTIIVFTITLAYAVLVLQRFSRQTPTISVTSQFEPDATNLTLPRFGVSVQILTEAQCNYTVAFHKQTSVDGNSAFNHLEEEACQFPGMVLPNSTVFCPTEQVQIGGTRLVSRSSSLMTIIVKEKNFFYPYPCPQTEVGLLVDQGGRTYSFQALGDAQGHSPVYQMPLSQYETVESANLLTTFRSSSTVRIMTSQLSYVGSVAAPPTAAPGSMSMATASPGQLSESADSASTPSPSPLPPVYIRELMILRLFYSGEHTTEKREYQTSLDVIGQCFAFYSAVVSGFAVLLRWYNERKFYIENPSWDSFDGHFIRVPATEEVGEHGQEMNSTSPLTQSLLTADKGPTET